MGEVIVAADPVKLAIAWFEEHGVHAEKNRPKEIPVDGVVCIRRIGGSSTLVTDSPWLYVEAYADTDEAAADLGHLAWGLLFAMQGEVIVGVPCYRVSTIAGPADMPDPEAQQPRYVMTVQAQFRTSVWTPPDSV